MFLSNLVSAADDFIMHYGVGADDGPPGRGSGRYPKGSGENPHQHPVTLLEKEAFYKAKYPGITRPELAELCGIVNKQGKPSTVDYDRIRSAEVQNRDCAKRFKALEMYKDGKNYTDIARVLDVKSSNTISHWVKEGEDAAKLKPTKTAKLLKDFVDNNKYVDISTGTNSAFNVTPGQFETAVAMLEAEGYHRHKISIKSELGKSPTYDCLVPPDATYSELWDHRFDITNPVTAPRVISPEGELSSLGIPGGKPTSIDVSRIQVEYESPKDGLIELRRGIDDLSLGNKSYAQVRIAVDDSHYMKGMAVYRDDMPPGIDVIVCSNKKPGTPLLVKDDPDAKQVLKPMKTIKDKDGNVTGIDWDNPFGASISQKSEIMGTYHDYYDKDGKLKRSAINVLKEEGDWASFSRSLASQYWSKQPLETAKRQLDLKVADKKVELESIRAIENPTVRKYFLEKFSEDCDSLAVHLKAAPFKGQMTRVLLPCPELSDHEVYAPGYPDGTKVTLVRYPFAGEFEAPLLTVRNIGSPAQKVIPLTAKDAVCINKAKLDQMSGADVDGDFAIIIPITDTVKVNTRSDTLDELKGFDTKAAFPGYDGMTPMSHKTHGVEMGKTTNLLMDMTLKKAPTKEVAHVTQHSMVVVDAEKHKLNWKASEEANHIRELKHRYQDDGQGHTGAGTIITRAKSPQSVPERRQWRLTKNSIDEEGNKIPKYTNRMSTTARLNLSDVKLTSGEHVKLSYDKSERSFYYLNGDKDPNTGKRIRTYVNDDDLPENLKGVHFNSEGRVYLNKDKNDTREYYVRKDENNKNVRVYVSDADVIGRKVKPVMEDSTKMAEHKDAFEITSGGSKETPGHPMELIAANYANEMKELARYARREWARTGDQVYKKDAAKKYSEEVAAIERGIAEAQASAPIERQARRMAAQTLAIKKAENPDMTYEQRKKIEGQALASARLRLNSTKKRFEITPKMYEAISAGAINKTTLEKLFNNTDMDSLRAMATPKAKKSLSTANKSAIKRLLNSGVRSASEIARMFGISESYVSEIANG